MTKHERLVEGTSSIRKLTPEEAPKLQAFLARTPSKHDRALMEKYRKFEVAWAALREAQKLDKNDLSTGTAEERANHRVWERAVDRAFAAAKKVFVSPADTIEGMLLKIRVFGFFVGNGHEKLQDLDQWTRGDMMEDDDVAVITVLRSDLRRLMAAAISDPIFSLIETHRAALQEFNSAEDMENGIENKNFRRAEANLWKRPPKTAAGWAALIRYAQQEPGELSIESCEKAFWVNILPKLADFLEAERPAVFQGIIEQNE